MTDSSQLSLNHPVIAFRLGYCGVCQQEICNTIGVNSDNTLVIAIPPVAAMLPLSVIGVTDVTVTLSVTVAQRFGVSLIISTCELHRHQELFLLQHLSLQLSCLNYPVGGSVLGYCGVCCV
jgi:hypothetical protein